mmetsp:Transcript_9112/g.14817  ORF Transcript_9112/g.14817 Transcript_9112/m.14817 type:complete len:311 (+) Transcript_9112:46-978(+)
MGAKSTETRTLDAGKSPEDRHGRKNKQSRSLRELFVTMILVSRPGLWHVTVFLYMLPAAADLKVLLTRDAVAGLFFVLFPMNLTVYGMNDLKDVDIDSKSDRKGGLYGAQASSEDLRICVIVGVLLSYVFPVLLIDDIRWCAAWTTASVSVNWLYNFGPTLSRVPVLDMVCPLGYLLVIPFAAKTFRFDSHVGRWFVAYMGLIIFRTQLWFQRFDSESDKASGKRTTAVALGKIPSVILLLFILVCEIGAATAWDCFAAKLYSVYCVGVLVLELTLGGKTSTLALMTLSVALVVGMIPCLATAWHAPSVP